MKISLSWLKEYVDLPAGLAPEELARRLTFAGFEVEAIQRQADGLDKVFVGELLEVKQHPNADRLSLTKVNVGDALGTGEILGIVCGAKNIKVGQKVPVATVGAVIPNGLEIKASKIRGEPSAGMLCSPAELKIEAKEGAEGILILAPEAKVGQPFAEYLGLDDVIFEINVTPNRGDALSHFGIAREVAAIFGLRVRFPEPQVEEKKAPVAVGITSRDTALCPVYFARYVEGVKVGPSPDWLRKRIEALGLRSVNNVVDVTSFVLYETGQPIHAFDANTIEMQGRIAITVRAAREKEDFSTISHKQIRLDPQDIVIGAGPQGEMAAALGGVMGSDRTEVSETTRNVLIESADFNAAHIRKTNRGHALMTDAAYRFERGVDPARIRWAADRAAALIQKVAGGYVSELFSSPESEANVVVKRPAVGLTAANIARVLGVNPGLDRAQKILETLGFAVARAGERLDVTPPTWRRDIECAEDLVEEVGRIWGYENLVASVPHGMVPFRENVAEWNAQTNTLRRLLAAQGFSEALNFSFSSREAEALVLGKEATAALVEMQGIQGKEFNVMKSSLVPGLLRNVSQNLARGRTHVALFEIRTCFSQAGGARKDTKLDTGVAETERLAIAVTGPALVEDWEGKREVADFYSLKGIVETLFEAFGRRGIQWNARELPAYLHPGQAAALFLGNRAFGAVGRVHPRVEKALDLGQAVYVAEMELGRLVSNAPVQHRFKAFSRFPTVERDFSATVKDSVDSATLRALALKSAKPLARDVRFFDVYRGERVPAGHVSYAFRVLLSAEDHTLTDKEISDAQAAIMRTLEKEVGAKFAGL